MLIKIIMIIFHIIKKVRKILCSVYPYHKMDLYYQIWYHYKSLNVNMCFFTISFVFGVMSIYYVKFLEKFLIVY